MELPLYYNWVLIFLFLAFALFIIFQDWFNNRVYSKGKTKLNKPICKDCGSKMEWNKPHKCKKVRYGKLFVSIGIIILFIIITYFIFWFILYTGFRLK